MSIELRREQLFALDRPLLREIFAKDGSVLPHVQHPALGDANDARSRFWHSYAALTGDENDRQLGNAILRKTSMQPGYDFGMVSLFHAWLHLNDRLDEDVRNQMESCIRLSGRPQVKCDHGFVGMNDNFAAMAVMNAVLAGEYNNDEVSINWGKNKLTELVQRLERDGVISEYNSPTYTPITMLCMAEIVEYAKDDELREMALHVETQTWLHSLACYHPGIGIQSGPTSRSYMVDSCGHLSSMNATYYMIFGDKWVPFHPAKYGFGQERRWVVHHKNIYYPASSICWQAIVNYHPPDEAFQLVKERSFPDTVIATASSATRWRPDVQRMDESGKLHERVNQFTPIRMGPVLLTTHMAKDFSLGTSSGVPACGNGGQQDGFLATWRRRTPTEISPLLPEDVCTLFTRYTINDIGPNDSGCHDLFSDLGYKTAVQQNAAAIVLYQPSPMIPLRVSSMRLCLVMPIHCQEIENLWLGKVAWNDDVLESFQPVPVWIEDGRVRICIIPTVITKYHIDQPVMRVKKEGKFMLIELINYQGPERTLQFHQHALCNTQNGFVCEMAGIEEDRNMDAFRDRISKGKLTEYWKTGNRFVHYTREHVDICIEHDPYCWESIPDARIAGQSRSHQGLIRMYLQDRMATENA